MTKSLNVLVVAPVGVKEETQSSESPTPALMPQMLITVSILNTPYPIS